MLEPTVPCYINETYPTEARGKPFSLFFIFYKLAFIIVSQLTSIVSFNFRFYSIFKKYFSLLSIKDSFSIYNKFIEIFLQSVTYLLLFIGIFSLLSGILTNLLPETKNEPLCDTLEEMKSHRKIYCFK